MERSCMCCQESGEREAVVSLFCPKAKPGERKFRKVREFVNSLTVIQANSFWLNLMYGRWRLHCDVKGQWIIDFDILNNVLTISDIYENVRESFIAVFLFQYITSSFKSSKRLLFSCIICAECVCNASVIIFCYEIFLLKNKFPSECTFPN